MGGGGENVVLIVLCIYLGKTRITDLRVKTGGGRDRGEGREGSVVYTVEGVPES